MKNSRGVSGLLLVASVLAYAQTGAAQSDQNSAQIRQQGDGKILMSVGRGSPSQSTDHARPVKQLSEQQRQLLEQQSSAASGGPRLPDNSAVENTDVGKSVSDGRPVLTQESPGVMDKKSASKLRLLSKPDPTQGKSEVVVEVQ